MIIKNIFKTVILTIKGGNLAKGMAKYKLNLKDFLIKTFTRQKKIDINCVLLGYPRSGTHWLRNVVQSSTKKYCPTLEEIDIQKVLNQKKLFLIKIHARSKLILFWKMFFLLPPHNFKKKFIYIYRDPRDSIISLYNMYNILKKKSLSQEDFLRVYDPIGQYLWEIKSWVLSKKSKNKLLVRFEDMKLKQSKTFKEIFDFLDINLKVNEKSVNELVGVVEKNHRVKGSVYGWKENYHKYKVLIDEINIKLEKIIKHLGYD